MHEIKLKPCPFCGGEAIIAYYGINYVRVECKVCHASVNYYHTKEVAAAKWNTRVTDAEKSRAD